MWRQLKMAPKTVIPQDVNPISAELLKLNQYRSFEIYPYKTWRSIPSLSTAIYNICLSTSSVLTGVVSLAASIVIILPIGLVKSTLNPFIHFITWIRNRNNTTPPRRRCVVITGSNSGIGAALALEYAKTPNTHLVLIARDIPRLNLVADQARTLADKITTEVHSIDFLDYENSPNEIYSLLNKLDAEFHGIDVAIAAAGVSGHRSGVLLPPSESAEGHIPSLPASSSTTTLKNDGPSSIATLGSRILQVNVNVTQQFILHSFDLMRSRRRAFPSSSSYNPSIVILSSVASYFTPGNFIFYGATKTYLGILGRTLSLAGVEHGINVLPVTPGFIKSPMTRNMSILGCTVPLATMGDAERLARRVKKREESGERGSPVVWPVWQGLGLYGMRAGSPAFELWMWWGAAAIGMAGWSWS
ncbi:hypothetical protein QBC38DRAFT_377612 [Podospora fimiseda]|uniref:NAD(P)-binding protein n=1 Tax=Podospora fimiseda TaxID=252190 RepID=A0AAN6YL94_9PEZI|nr:hypothetical protein QBC38DRAFT_377612 [Podospora fimiseda]